MTGAAPPIRERTPRRALQPGDGRLRRGQRSRARIRAAARALFRERGFDRTTLRAIAERAGMGASSIYRHVQSKEELLVQELADLQEQAWRRFRAADERSIPTRERIRRFLEAQHELLIADPDLTTIALRAASYPQARVAQQVLALHERTIGLLVEILQSGRGSGDLAQRVDVLAAAQAIFHITAGARIPWANRRISAEVCRRSVAASVDLLFGGLDASR